MLHIRIPPLAGARLLAFTLLIAAMATAWAADTRPLAFPGAQGSAAHTPGGRGGTVLRVTTLAAEGPGSLKAALMAKGPRTVVFEVGGVIDLGMKELRISEPFLTVAGQTAPHPGVTIIKGGLTIATHDVVIRHIRIRPGDGGMAKRSGDIDAITTVRGAHDVIVDHCSLTWATDENLSASSTRFHGESEAEWMANASRRITYSNNIVGEGLANATHPKGEHSKGSLIHDHVNEVLIVGNLYAHNYERSPLFKGGARGQVVNNLIYNPGQRAIHYNLIAEEWLGHPYSRGEMAVRGNVMRAGRSTEPLAFFMIGGSGDLDLYLQDNLVVDRVGNKSIQDTGSYTTAPLKLNRVKSAPALPFGVTLLASEKVQDSVIENVGATPWNRDLIDRRIVADVIEGRGEIIDSQEQVGGYPQYKEARKPFVESEWNLDVMEPLAGYPRGEPLR
ncbi:MULTISPECIES: pectate lyase [unclassified Pseudoxanthomonas]|uniref:pectate lyase family protein n=1 Tax=unclassified Pseudoxanthomonas TaxID=2645906 RepID=UPI0008E2F6FD|nr:MULTISPECIES: pectate lyase [unclassified Pseudoxanthomonas]PPJ41433.1 pectate lyase [Pseudoxanthomonas sp. KAs_5_3]SFV30317.1 Pectate lyase [Pseudoxanthomonas sp. YR558]